jgi:hypothetical protein
MRWFAAVLLVAIFILNAVMVFRLMFHPKWRQWLDQLNARNLPLAFTVIWLNSAVAGATSLQCLYLFGIGPGVTAETAVGWVLITVVAFLMFEGGWLLSRRLSR